MSTVEITKSMIPLTPLVIRRATLLDVDRIAAIEKKSFYNGGGHARFLALQVANATESVNCAEQLVLVVLIGGLVISYAIWERWGDSDHYWDDQKTIYPLELEHEAVSMHFTTHLLYQLQPHFPISGVPTAMRATPQSSSISRGHSSNATTSTG